jgi:thioredoxin 1
MATNIVPEINLAAYQAMITKDSLVLVDFYAPWCAPCKQMAPMLKKIETKYGSKVKLIRINIDEQPNLAKSLQVNELPVFNLYYHGEFVKGLSGLQTEESITSLVNSYITK